MIQLHFRSSNQSLPSIVYITITKYFSLPLTVLENPCDQVHKTIVNNTQVGAALVLYNISVCASPKSALFRSHFLVALKSYLLMKKNFLKKEDTCWDIGAHIGDSCLGRTDERSTRSPTKFSECIARGKRYVGDVYRRALRHGALRKGSLHDIVSFWNAGVLRHSRLHCQVLF